MTTSLENFGTLEYVQDKYSKLWCWKITGTLAIDKISSLTSKAWYGESENEVINPYGGEKNNSLAPLLYSNLCSEYNLILLFTNASLSKSDNSLNNKFISILFATIFL